MKKHHFPRRRLIVKVAFVLVFIFLLLSPASYSINKAENRFSCSFYGGIKTPMEYFLKEKVENSFLFLGQELSLPYTGSKEGRNKHFERISPFLLLIAGILAGFNPCLLAVMAFLASVTLVEQGRRKDMLKITCGFSAGIFTMYMLTGVSILSMVSFLPQIQEGFIEAATLIIALLGFWHIYDAYWLKKHSRSTFRTPQALKNFMSKMGNKNVLLLSFLSGGMFSLVKAPCVGAIFLSLLSILVTKTDVARGTTYMGIYNIGLLVPVIGLGLLLASGLSPSRVTEFRERWRVEIRLTTGFILMFVALLMQLEII